MPVVKESKESANLIEAISFCHNFSNTNTPSPLVILGEDLLHVKDITSVLDFIQKTDALVALTPNSKGLFDNQNSRFLGLIGVMGHQEVNDYLNHTDILILIGVNFDLLNRYGIQEVIHSKKVLVFKEEKSLGLYHIEGESACEVYGNIEENIAQICSSIPINRSSYSVKLNHKNIASRDEYNLKNIINIIQIFIGDDGNVFIDAGNTGAFVIHHLQTRGNSICYVSLGMGGMGNSIGVGIGSSVVAKKKSYVFLGDGSFLMHGLEIHTAVEYDLPIVFFILNNNSHGMCTTRENIFFDCETGLNNFKKSHYAEGMGKIFPGIIAYDVNDLLSLEKSLNDIPGDGFAVSYVTNNDERPFLTFEFENYPEFSEDMRSNCDGKHWWEMRESTGCIDFNENKLALIVARGNKTVPKMIKKVCDNIKVNFSDIDYLITNQPNTNFLRNWREAISLPKEKQLETFENYANLFGAAIPVNLATYTKNNTIKRGDLLCLAGFSHACDYSGAALIRWT